MAKKPLDLSPQLLTANVPKEETILEEINRTGVLKVAVRSDAAPVGYLKRQSKFYWILCQLNQLPRRLSRNKARSPSWNTNDRFTLKP